MAEFVQTMKDWRRMCKAQDDGSNRDVCATCPLKHGCSAIYEDDDMDYVHVEQVVMKWVSEHPEPVYPTWGEYITMIMLDDITHRNDNNPQTLGQWMNKTHIPADMAQKLGIQPKEVDRGT